MLPNPNNNNSYNNNKEQEHNKKHTISTEHINSDVICLGHSKARFYIDM